MAKKILIVEDEMALLQVQEDFIKKAGYESIIANEGEAGLTLALAEHPDLVILDILMPKMDGLTVLKHLREDTWGKNVPVIIFTNVAVEDAVVAKLVQYDPAYYFMKSDMKLEELLGKIKETLNLPAPDA